MAEASHPQPALPVISPREAVLHDFASRYIWWKTPNEAVQYPERVLAQVMNLGTYEDLGRLLAEWTPDELRLVLAKAEPGWFTERSWAFWHLRLCGENSPPPLPRRTFLDDVRAK